MDETILDLAQLFSNAKERALPAGQADITPLVGETSKVTTVARFF